MKRLPYIILALFILVSLPAAAQDKDALRKAGNELRFRVIDRFDSEPEVLSDTLKDALAREDWKAAHKELTTLTLDGDYLFLRGYVALKAQDFPAALKDLTPVASSRSELAEYGARFAAEAAFELKDYVAAAGFAANVSTNPHLKPQAIWYLGESLTLAGRPDDGTRAFRSLVASYPRHSVGRKTRATLAQNYAVNNRWDDAAREWLKLTEISPLSAEGLNAAKELNKARKSKKLSKTMMAQSAPNQTRTLLYYRAVFGAHQSKKLSQELPAKLDKWKTGSKEWCEGTYLVASSYTKLRDHKTSEPWYSKVIKSCPGSHRRNALYKGGKARWNAGDKSGAVAWFQRLWQEFPTHSYADDAYYFAARIQREQGNTKQANALIAEQVTKYPKGDMAKDSRWLQVRSLWAASDWKAVVDYVDQVEVTGEDDIYSDGRLSYFRARALELSGKKKEAKLAYRQTIQNHPLSYYAFLAITRAPQLNEKGLFVSKATSIPEANSLVRSHAGFQRAMILVTLNLTKLARPELRSLAGLVQEQSDQLWVIADALDRAGAYTLAHDIPRRDIKNWEDHYPDPKSRRLWDIAYPQPFHTQVAAYAAKRGLPEALIYGIIREESGFNPGVESWANARGLMQLIEDTARLMAKKDGLTFNWNDLFYPEVGIRLGSRYLKTLSDDFEANPALIIAGYNGGRANVTRWLEAGKGNDLDILVEDIPYGQTRKYTKRVLRSFWVYSYLGGTQVPQVSMHLNPPD